MSRSGERGERSIALFLLALLLFSPLILSIFNQEELFFGLPPLYAYLFTAWGGIIAVVGWSAWRNRDKVEPYEQEKLPEATSYTAHDPSITDKGDISQSSQGERDVKGSAKGDSDAG